MPYQRESTLPDMTANWEHQLQGMAERSQAYHPFMRALEDNIDKLMTQMCSSQPPESLRALPKTY